MLDGGLHRPTVQRLLTSVIREDSIEHTFWSAQPSLEKGKLHALRSVSRSVRLPILRDHRHCSSSPSGGSSASSIPLISKSAVRKRRTMSTIASRNCGDWIGL